MVTIQASKDMYGIKQIDRELRIGHTIEYCFRVTRTVGTLNGKCGYARTSRAKPTIS